MLEDVYEAYKTAVLETDKDAAIRIALQAVEAGIRPEDIVFQIVIPVIAEIMSSIQTDPDANLAQHFLTAQIASEVTERMLERFSRPPEIIGKVVIGTAAGDLHSLGKRIVMGCLKAMMVETIDLGVNVTAERFVDEAVKHNADVIAVSAMMVHTAVGENGASRVRALLAEKGLEKRMRLVVGGAPYRFDTGLYKTVGADAWAPDGVSAARVIVDLIHEVNSL